MSSQRNALFFHSLAPCAETREEGWGGDDKEAHSLDKCEFVPYTGPIAINWIPIEECENVGI
jgi:hypothetical protein